MIYKLQTDKKLPVPIKIYRFLSLPSMSKPDKDATLSGTYCLRYSRVRKHLSRVVVDRPRPMDLHGSKVEPDSDLRSDPFAPGTLAATGSPCKLCSLKLAG